MIEASVISDPQKREVPNVAFDGFERDQLCDFARVKEPRPADLEIRAGFPQGPGRTSSDPNDGAVVKQLSEERRLPQASLTWLAGERCPKPHCVRTVCIRSRPGQLSVT